MLETANAPRPGPRLQTLEALPLVATSSVDPEGLSSPFSRSPPEAADHDHLHGREAYRAWPGGVPPWPGGVPAGIAGTGNDSCRLGRLGSLDVSRPPPLSPVSEAAPALKVLAIRVAGGKLPSGAAGLPLPFLFFSGSEENDRAGGIPPKSRPPPPLWGQRPKEAVPRSPRHTIKEAKPMPPTQAMYVEPIFLPLIPSSMTRGP